MFLRKQRLCICLLYTSHCVLICGGFTSHVVNLKHQMISARSCSRYHAASFPYIASDDVLAFAQFLRIQILSSRRHDIHIMFKFFHEVGISYVFEVLFSVWRISMYTANYKSCLLYTSRCV